MIFHDLSIKSETVNNKLAKKLFSKFKSDKNELKNDIIGGLWYQSGSLGTGKFSKVIRGVDSKTGQQVALKQITDNSKNVFEKEINTLLRINNSNNNIIKLLAYEKTDLIVLELAQYGTLY